MVAFFLLSILCFLIAIFGLVVRLNPKRWRRIYQGIFERARRRQINRNKSIDEAIPAPVLRISMFCLLLAVTFAFLGIKTRNFSTAEDPSTEELGPLDVVAEEIVEDALRSAEAAPTYKEAGF